MALKTQLEVDQEQDQIIPIGHKVVKQVCWLKTLVGLCPIAKYDAHHCRCKWDDDVMEKHSKIGQKIKRLEINLDVIVEEIAQKCTHCTKRQNPPFTIPTTTSSTSSCRRNDLALFTMLQHIA